MGKSRDRTTDSHAECICEFIVRQTWLRKDNSNTNIPWDMIKKTPKKQQL